MKCKDCFACHKGWFPSRRNDYVCTGVAEPFVIKDINVECTEYDELRNMKSITNADNIRSMNDKELAEFLMSKWFVNEVCKNCEGEYYECGDYEYCTKEILKWLSKEKK